MSRVTVLLAIFLAGFFQLAAQASYTSLRVFGDGVCTTTGNEAGGSLYHENRFCNGRVWVEVIANWQGIAYVQAHNISDFGNGSEVLLNHISTFTQPADAATSLFVIWAANADLVNFAFAQGATNQPAWTNFINGSIARHTQAITNIYNKGARTLVMPTAVDISSVPYFNNPSSEAFLRSQAVYFNQQFEIAIVAAMASKPGLTIYKPDAFAFFDSIVENPSSFGLIKPETSATEDLADPKKNSGPGPNYVFWDYLHPTAKTQMHLAALIQQMISPVKVNGLSVSGITGHLTIANIPLGRQGIVQGSGTLQAPWTQDTTFTLPFAAGASTTGSVTVPASGARRFYRVNFPVVWAWP